MLPQLPAPLFPSLLVRKLLQKQKPIPQWPMPKQTWKLLLKQLIRLPMQLLMLLTQLLQLLARLPMLLLQPQKTQWLTETPAAAE